MHVTSLSLICFWMVVVKWQEGLIRIYHNRLSIRFAPTYILEMNDLFVPIELEITWIHEFSSINIFFKTKSSRERIIELALYLLQKYESTQPIAGLRTYKQHIRNSKFEGCSMNFKLFLCWSGYRSMFFNLHPDNPADCRCNASQSIFREYMSNLWHYLGKVQVSVCPQSQTQYCLNH